MAIEIVNFPIKNGDFLLLFVGSPEGSEVILNERPVRMVEIHPTPPGRRPNGRVGQLLMCSKGADGSLDFGGKMWGTWDKHPQKTKGMKVLKNGSSYKSQTNIIYIYISIHIYIYTCLSQKGLYFIQNN